MERRVARGEVWTAAGGPDYAGKPRPVVIVQSNRFSETHSCIVCLLTTDPTDLSLMRVTVHPDAGNGLRVPCRLMVDKLATLPKSKLGRRIGRLSTSDQSALNLALFVFLGLG